MSNHFIVVKIAAISDLESDGRLELLQFEDISQRERPSRKGLERTELNVTASAERTKPRGCVGDGELGDDGVQPIYRWEEASWYTCGKVVANERCALKNTSLQGKCRI